MNKRFDHIDLRVPDLTAATPFYTTLLPALGFTRRVAVEGWLQFETRDGDIAEFFGITESPSHVANENRVAFRAFGKEEVNRIASVAAAAGARNMEGPMEYETEYYAVFFDDPFGNRLEVCFRRSNAPEVIG